MKSIQAWVFSGYRKAVEGEPSHGCHGQCCSCRVPTGTAGLAAAEAVQQFERFDSPWTSRSEIARRLNVADSTLRYWLRTRWWQVEHGQCPGDTVRFLENPEDLSILHRLLTAAHLVFVHANDCGIRNLSAF